MRIGLRSAMSLLGSAMLAAASLGAYAEAWPTKPVRIISAFPPGGPTDILARLLGHKLSESLKQPFIVENKAGAGGNIGTDYVAKSPPDGYTYLLTSSGPAAINASLYKKLPFDPTKDFAPVTLVAAVPLVLAVHPSVPAKNLKELIEHIKAQKGKFTYASAGNGTPQHLTGEMFKTMAGVEMVHVPYKGSAPAINDLLGGHVPIMFDSMVSILPHVKGGKLKPLAVSSAKRSPQLPDVPTVAESGIPGFEALAWYGLLAPAGTPKEIIAKMNAECLKAMQLPDVKERLASLGSEYVGNSPEQFDAFIKAETAKWAKVVKESGATPD